MTYLLEEASHEELVSLNLKKKKIFIIYNKKYRNKLSEIIIKSK